jgi:hypothetical protein
MSANAYIPIIVSHAGKNYSITLPQFQFSQADMSAMGIKARLYTAEEVADQPQMIAYLAENNLGILKKIN